MRKRDAAKVKVGDEVRYTQGCAPASRVIEVINHSDNPRDKLPLFVLNSGEVITYLLLEKVQEARCDTSLFNDDHSPVDIV